MPYTTSMKPLITLLPLLFLTTLTYSQKQYVWCPESIKVSARNNLPTASVRLLITDGRMIADKTRGDCDIAVFENGFLAILKQAWPNSSAYTGTDGKEEVYINVIVEEHHTNFFPSLWIGYSKLNVRIKDQRGGEVKEYTKQIAVERKSGNALGRENGKRALEKAYSDAISELLAEITKDLT